MSEPDPVAMASVKRLFFALWPDEALRQQLYALGGELLGNRSAAVPDTALPPASMQSSRRCSTSAIPGVVGDHRGRRMPAENLHLTLAFLGYVSAERQACLEREASTVQSPAFTLTLDHAGFWPRKGILWVGGTPPEELLGLVGALQQGLTACGLEPETRLFQIHLTLARNVHQLRLDRNRVIGPLAWSVRQFALVASQTLPEGARYEILKRWNLVNGQD